MQHPLGIIGVATMGRSLALNFRDHGTHVAVFDVDRLLTDGFVAANPAFNNSVASSIPDLLSRLERPRRVLLMIRAGSPVDEVLADLKDQLEPGDIVIDGGNALFHETRRRGASLAENDIEYVGLGVSGGEAGARHGPSMMAGASESAWSHLGRLFMPIAAQTAHGPCAARMGTDGAGHFVKMVHNGIEYGDMQCIAEVYDVLTRGLAHSADAAADCFAQWNKGPLGSYLIELTATVLRHKQADGSATVESIFDSAGQKGTGRWTVIAALELGVSVPTIAAAVDARVLSSQHDVRQQLARDEDHLPEPGELSAALEHALLASRVCAYAQGLQLIAAGNAEYNWDIPLDLPPRVWSGGCIIRAKLLDDIITALAIEPNEPNLLAHESLGTLTAQCEPGLRQAVSFAASAGIPTPALSASLAWIDMYRSARMPQNLTQAQRDAFGAHTYQRLDDPTGPALHTDWFE